MNKRTPSSTLGETQTAWKVRATSPMLVIHEPASRVISDGVEPVDNDHSPQRFFGSSQAAAVHVTIGVVCVRASETSCRNNIHKCKTNWLPYIYCRLHKTGPSYVGWD